MVKFVIFMKKEPYCLTTAGKAFLREAWVDSNKTITGIAAQLGIGDMQILYRFAAEMKLGGKITQSSYSTFEDDIIKRGWQDPDKSCEQIVEELTGRTVIAVKARATRLKLGRKEKNPKAVKSVDSKAWPADMPDFEDHPRAVNKGPKYDDHHKIGFDF